MNNSNGAVGFFRFDTNVLANRVHTIAWVVTDDAGAAAGIGSRFFTVDNTGTVGAEDGDARGDWTARRPFDAGSGPPVSRGAGAW